jgi:hypothetical protein
LVYTIRRRTPIVLAEIHLFAAVMVVDMKMTTRQTAIVLPDLLQVATTVIHAIPTILPGSAENLWITEIGVRANRIIVTPNITQ